MAQRLSPIDAVSRMQTVSSTTVLPHERPVNKMCIRDRKMRALGTVQLPTEAFMAVLKLDEEN